MWIAKYTRTIIKIKKNDKFCHQLSFRGSEPAPLVLQTVLSI